MGILPFRAYFHRDDGVRQYGLYLNGNAFPRADDANVEKPDAALLG